MAGLLYRLGRFAARRRWLVGIAWILVLALGGAVYALFGGAISTAISIPGTATTRVTDELSREFPSASGGSGSIVFERSDAGAFDNAQKADIVSFLRRVGDLDGVRRAVNPFTSQQQIDDQRTKLSDGRKQLVSGEKQLDAGQQQLDAGQQQLDASQKQLDQQEAQAKAAGQLANAQPQLDAAQAQLDAQQKTIDAQQRKITDGRTTLDTDRTKLELGQRLLNLSKNMRFVSTDGSTALATVAFTKPTTEVAQSLKTRIAEDAVGAGIPGVRVLISNEIAQGIPSVVGPGEVVGLLVAAVVLVLVLGTIIGAVLPLVSALLGVGVAILGALSFSGVIQFVSVTPVLAVMLGLAVGIDYSLFIINRHRRQLKQGVGLHESIGLANGTSGNAVVFAGTTVIVALLALNITGVPFLGLMGSVGGAAVAVAILIAITLTPALLSIVGMRVLRRSERAAIGAPDDVREPAKPMAAWRAVVTLVLGVAALGIIALPAKHMRLGLPVGSSEAVDSTQYQAYTVTGERFGEGQNGPLLVVANLPQEATGTPLLQEQVTIGERIAAQNHVAAVALIGSSKDDRVIAFQVIPTGGPSSESTEQLVHDLRDLSPLTVDRGDVGLGVAGNASANIDISEKLGAVLPLYVGVVVGLSVLILILMFRSFLVPVTATIGFVLSLLATFGGLTGIYQFGWLHQVFGVHDPAPILSFLPIIEVGILFGLAMDYQLFLVSGVREAYAHGVPAKLAVQHGVHAGRAVVTAAAIIMTSVFSGFVFSDSSTIRPIGFGLAFGVLVDAFIVRMLLIPAVMRLLGNAAWWFPEWLDRLLPDVDVEGTKLERAHPSQQHETDAAHVATGPAGSLDDDPRRDQAARRT